MALKKVKMGPHEKEGFPLTAIREINVLLSFHHPNIVNVSEVGGGRQEPGCLHGHGVHGA